MSFLRIQLAIINWPLLAILINLWGGIKNFPYSYRSFNYENHVRESESMDLQNRSKNLNKH